LRIESRHNERLREVARLVASSRERRKSGRCVLEGTHLVDVYRARVGVPETLVVVDDRIDEPEIARLVAHTPPVRTLVVSRKLFAEIATSPPDVGVLADVGTPRAKPHGPGTFCLLLEDVQDPGNVGSIIRTAAAAGVEQVLLSRHCAFAWSPKVLRAGQGAHFLTTLVEDVDLVAWAAAFRRHGGQVSATAVAGGTPVYRADLRGRVAIAIGSEGRGLSDALLAVADQRITIPMAAGSESLNAAAATAVALFEAVRQRGSERGP
jgi:TrmH family RNA methyltransferase